MSHLKFLKGKLSGYGIDPFLEGYPFNLSRGGKIDRNVYNGMCQVEILAKEWKKERMSSSRNA